jgi:hypothetical protein
VVAVVSDFVAFEDAYFFGAVVCGKYFWCLFLYEWNQAFIIIYVAAACADDFFAGFFESVIDWFASYKAVFATF